MDEQHSLPNLHSIWWFQRLPASQKELLQQSFLLLEEDAVKQKIFYDYSFIIMPAAKAFEGFVKDVLFYLNLISEQDYKGNRFRVGKALNPQLAQKNPDKFNVLFDDLKRRYPQQQVAELLWKTWKQCRNQVFHYFVTDGHQINLYEAKDRLQLLTSTMEKVSRIIYQKSAT